MVDRDGLAGELKAFRKGRAAQHPHFVQRLGSRLRRLTGVGDTDPQPVARAKLRDWVERSMSDQPADLVLAAMVGFALHPEARQETLVERQQWLAGQRDFHPRTARRRMDEALDAILTAVRDNGGTPPAGATGSDWRVCSLEAVLRLTTDGPTLMERRIIEFAAPEVDEITCRLSVPRRTGRRPRRPACSGRPCSVCRSSTGSGPATTTTSTGCGCPGGSVPASVTSTR